MASTTKISPEEHFGQEITANFRSESLNGEILAKPASSFDHSSVLANLATALNNRLKPSPFQACTSDLRILVPSTSFFAYPDLLVVAYPAFHDGHRDAVLNPTLLAEVLSPSTESYDRGRKFAQYREIETLAEYLLVAQDAPRIEQFVRAGDGRWIYSVASGLEATLELPSLGTVIALAEVYDKVELGG